MNLPTGIVTFLFTDIEGSAALAQRFPAELPDLLTRHHAILNAAIQAHNGHVFQIIGDAFSAAFFTPWDALNAAIAAQRQLQRENWGSAIMRVRMGIHTGAAQAGVIEEKAGGYVGYLTLTRTQRVMSAAYGEQVLISHSSAQLVRPDLPPSVTLRDMGEHALKGLTEPERLWQPVAPELRTDFPPLKTGNAAVNTLPANLTPLIGREAELAQVQTLLSQPANRLITLTGMGGMGKTHFAQVVAAHVAPSFADGVMYVSLAPVRDADLVIPTIARAFGLQDSGGGAGLDALIKHLHDKVLLLVLDNFEQVVEAGHDLARLLQMAKQLKIIITSRVLLRVEGELAFALSPLARASAQDLFLARAQAVVGAAGYAAQANAYDAAISAICKPLEGIPLAIELAASQLRLYSLSELLERLKTPLKTLATRQRGNRSASARALLQVLDSSYELLSADQQRLFRGMGVFVGGATLMAITIIMSPPHPSPETNDALADDLMMLIDSSLVQHTITADGQSRYQMHELVREYARDRADAAAEMAELGRRHTEFFAGWACDRKMTDYKQWVETELANVRVALQWCKSNLDEQHPLQIQIATWEWHLIFGVRQYLQYFGYIHEADAIGQHLFKHRHWLTPVNHVNFLTMLSDELWLFSNDVAQESVNRMQTTIDEGLALMNESYYLAGQSWFWMCLGSLKLWENKWDEAWHCTQTAYDLGRRALYEPNLVQLKPNSNTELINKTPHNGSYRVSANHALAGATQQAATMLEFQGNYAAALPYIEESIALKRLEGTASVLLRRLLGYGRILLGLARRTEAVAAWVEALQLIQNAHSQIETPYALFSVTQMMIVDEEWVIAARWMSAADTFRRGTGMFNAPMISERFNHTVTQIQAFIADADIAAAWEVGKLLTHEQALDEMLAMLTAAQTAEVLAQL